MNDYLVGHIRTFVPIAVGYVLTVLAQRFNILVPEEASAQLIAGITSAVSAVYYALVRAVAQKLPWAGVLLGVNKAPAYTGK